MAAALQRGAAAFEPWLSHAGRVRGEGRDARRNERPSDGAERCGTWGLRAPPRRTTASQGANQGSNRGGRLKLNVVRRIWAGHWYSKRSGPPVTFDRVAILAASRSFRRFDRSAGDILCTPRRNSLNLLGPDRSSRKSSSVQRVQRISDAIAIGQN